MSLMTHEALNGPDVPRALGPYSPAIKAGPLVFVSAQAGVDPRTEKVPSGGFEAECRQAFGNVALVLQAAGLGLCDVVKITVLYIDLEYLPIINAVYADLFPVNPPARTAAIVSLAGNRRIAVDAIAMAATN